MVSSSHRGRVTKTLLLLAVAVGVLLLDQWTKYLAVAELTSALHGRQGPVARLSGFVTEQNLDNRPNDVPGRPLRVLREIRFIEDYWHFRYVENPGAAWGLFANLPDRIRGPFFSIVTAAALAFILWMFRRVPNEQRFLQLALALVLGGAVGNFADRLLRGYVIDFIDWHWRNQPGMRWPTFNVADVAISVGVTMMVMDAVWAWARERRQARSAAAAVIAPSPDATPPVQTE